MTAVINKGPIFGMRHVQSLLIFFNITVAYISRHNIGMAVVAMRNAHFDWNEKQISYIISSFYWGYILTQFAGGTLSRQFGSKLIMGISIFGSAVLSAITPFFVIWNGWQAYCVIRIAQGLFQGMMFPSNYHHLAKWLPVEERILLGALSQTGFEFGTVMSMVVAGLVADGPLGWQGISYVSAGLCFIWCIAWLIFGADNATESKFITEEEKNYIESSLGHETGFHEHKIPIPWKAILLSVPFNALICARCAESWGLSTLQAQLPSYLDGVLKMNMKSNTLFSALPFLGMWIMSFVFLIFADIIYRKQILSITAIRKTLNSIAYCIPAAGLIAIGFLDETQKTLAISLMIISVTITSGSTIGSCLTPIDMAPNHAGVLMGIINSIANVMPIISPLVVGVIVTDTKNRYQWQIVFAIAAIILFVGNLIYVIFGTSKVQPWNENDYWMPKDADNLESDKSKDT